jgi:hypothetical protein
MAGLDRREAAQLWDVLGHVKESVRDSAALPETTPFRQGKRR